MTTSNFSHAFSESQINDPFKRRVKPGFDASLRPSQDWFARDPDISETQTSPKKVTKNKPD